MACLSERFPEYLPFFTQGDVLLTDLVSVIVVAYGPKSVAQIDTILRCLDKQTYRNIELIVVDNSRNVQLRDHLGAIKNLKVRIEYVPNENTGNAGGTVVGLPKAGGKFILVINPDTWFNRSLISTLCSYFNRSTDRVMVLVPKIMIKNTRRINSIGMKRMSPLVNFYSNIGYLEHDSGQYDKPVAVEAFDGPAFMFRAKLLEHMYLFDPRFFAGATTIDLAERLNELGFEIRTCPRAEVNHEMHGTVPSTLRGKFSAIAVRNILIHTLRNRGCALFLRTLCLGMLWGNVLKPLERGDYLHSMIYLSGVARFVLDIGYFAAAPRLPQTYAKVQ